MVSPTPDITIIYSPDDISVHDYLGLGLPYSASFETIEVGDVPPLLNLWELSRFGPSLFHVVSAGGLESTGPRPRGTGLRRLLSRGTSLVVALEPGANERDAMREACVQRDSVHTSDQIDLVKVKDELRQWLGISHDELSAISGINRGTFFNWTRSKAIPRAETVSRLLRVYALVRALRNQLGSTETAAWFRSGTPSPMDLLRRKEFDLAQRAAASVLFREEPPDDLRYAAFAPELDLDIQTTPRSDSPKRSTRGCRQRV